MTRSKKILTAALILLFTLLMTAGVFAAGDKLKAPKITKASSVSYNKIQLKWEAVPDAQSYSVFYKGGRFTKWTLVKSGIRGTQYTHVSTAKRPVAAGTTYTYTIKAVNGTRVSTIGYQTKSVKAVPGKVSIKKITVKAYDKLYITWNQVEGASGYRISRLENGKWVTLYNAKPTASAWTYKSSAKHPIDPNQACSYKVRAYIKADGKTVIGNGTSVTVQILNNSRASDSVGTAEQKTLRRAQVILGKITNASMSKEDKLWAAFRYVMNTYTGKRPRTPHYTGPDWPVIYANDMFLDGKGNCCSYAAAFGYLAKACGYDTVYCINSGGHGWVEINGLIYDPEEYRNTAHKYYGTSYALVPSYRQVVSWAETNPNVKIRI